MILYKYVSYDAGLRILKNNSIGFRQPYFFNDPFELSASYPDRSKENKSLISPDAHRTALKKHVWETYYSILSLTRSPLNPLMWAHYTNKYEGFAIGFDVTIELFTCEKKNFIPVQYGNVIYTQSKPTDEFISKPVEVLDVGTTCHFVSGHLEKTQRIFLYKPMYWSYEEEVRIVKCIFGVKEGKKTESGEFEVRNVDDADLFILNLPSNSVKEVFIGIRNPILNKNEEKVNFLKLFYSNHNSAKLYNCITGKKTWGLDYFEIKNG